MSERKLYRSRDDKIITGLCGGIGEYFRLDPTLVRIIFIILEFLTVGFLIIGYIIVAIIVPKKPVAPKTKT